MQFYIDTTKMKTEKKTKNTEEVKKQQNFVNEYRENGVK